MLSYVLILIENCYYIENNQLKTNFIEIVPAVVKTHVVFLSIKCVIATLLG